jgi:ankyrin repeat protein
MTDKNNLPATQSWKDRDLFFSCLQGDTARAERLLKAGANAGTRQARQDYAPPVSALYAAADADRVEVVRLLLRYHAKVDDGTPEGRTPLMVAVRRGNTDIAKLLIEAGARIDIAYGQDTLFDMAERCDDPAPMLRLLLEKLPPLKLKDIFLEAARDAKFAIIEVVATLPGFDVETHDSTGNTALILASQHTDNLALAAKTVRLLLDKGAVIDAENDMKETALTAAMMKRPVSAQAVKTLVEAGADITRETLAGISAIEAAQLSGNEEILPCFESARKQAVLREERKYFEGTGNKITIRKPLQPRKPPH